MSEEIQEAFERLLGEGPSRPGRRRANREAEAEAAELVALAHRLGRLREVEAPAHLRQRALRRAMWATPPRPSRVTPLSRWRRPPPSWAAPLSRIAAAVVAAVVVAYSGVAASAASLPDSPLYSVKLLVEDVIVAVAPPEQKPRLYVGQLERRLEETEAFVQEGRIQEAGQTMKAAAQRIEYAEAAAPSGRSDQVREQIESTVAQHRRTLDSFQQQGGQPPAALAAPASVAVSPAPAVRPQPPAPLPAAAVESIENSTEAAAAAVGPAVAAGIESSLASGQPASAAPVAASAPRLPANSVAAPQADFGSIAGSRPPASVAAPPAPAAEAPVASFAPIGQVATLTATPITAALASPSVPSPTASPTAATPPALPSPTGGIGAPTGGFQSIPDRLPALQRTGPDSPRAPSGL